MAGRLTASFLFPFLLTAPGSSLNCHNLLRCLSVSVVAARSGTLTQTLNFSSTAVFLSRCTALPSPRPAGVYSHRSPPESSACGSGPGVKAESGRVQRKKRARYYEIGLSKHGALALNLCSKHKTVTDQTFAFASHKCKSLSGSDFDSAARGGDAEITGRSDKLLLLTPALYFSATLSRHVVLISSSLRFFKLVSP